MKKPAVLVCPHCFSSEKGFSIIVNDVSTSISKAKIICRGCGRTLYYIHAYELKSFEEEEDKSRKLTKK